MLREHSFTMVNVAVLLIGTLLASLMWAISLYIVAGLLFVLIVIYSCSTDYSPSHGVSYRAIFILPGSLYALTPIYHIGFEGNYLHLSTKVFFNMLWGGMIFFGAFGLSLPRHRRAIALFSRSVVRYHKRYLVFLAATTVLFFAAYWFTSENSVDLSRGERLSTQNFLQTFVELALIANIMLYFSIALRDRRRWLFLGILLMAPYILTEIFYFGDRRTALSLIVGCAVMAVCAGRLNIRSRHIIVVIAVLPIILAFGVLRAWPVKNWFELLYSGAAFQNLSLMNTEFGASALVADTVGRARGVLAYDPSYYLVPVQLIPGSFLGRAPALMSPAIRYVHDFSPQIYAAGGGFGYNIVLEAFQNFNIFGPAIMGMFFAALFRIIVSIKSRQKLFILGCFAFGTVFSYRMDLAGWAQSCLYLCIIGLLLWRVATALIGKTRAKQA